MKALIIIIVVVLIVWGVRKWTISLIDKAWGGKGTTPSQSPKRDNDNKTKKDLEY